MMSHCVRQSWYNHCTPGTIMYPVALQISTHTKSGYCHHLNMV